MCENIFIVVDKRRRKKSFREMVFEKFFSKEKKPELPPSPPQPATPIKTPENDDKKYLNSMKDCRPTELEDYGY